MNRQPEIAEEDDDYRESEDEDYNPDKAAEGSDASDEGEDAEDRKLDAAYARYQGRGGLIKTRAQRRAEAEGRVPKDEPKPAAVVGETSVDVDALWKEMNSSTPSPARPASPSSTGKLGDEYITITRTFKFAGEVKTETKRVLRTSAEGQDYLRDQERKRNEEKAKSLEKLQKSESPEAGERNSDSDSQKADRADPRAALKNQGRQPVKRKMSLMEEYKMNKAKKINTLEKSRLDWLGFVDKEGIREDLTKHNKGGYLDKQDFLEQVDQKVDRDMRQQRAKRMN